MENNVQMYKLTLDDGYQANPLILQMTPEKYRVIRDFLNALEGWEEWENHDYDNIILVSIEEHSITL